MRLQKMLLSLQWYDLDVEYCRGKDVTVADAISRAYLSDANSDPDMFDTNGFGLLSVSKRKQAKTVKFTKIRTINILSGNC